MFLLFMQFLKILKELTAAGWFIKSNWKYKMKANKVMVRWNIFVLELMKMWIASYNGDTIYEWKTPWLSYIYYKKLFKFYMPCNTEFSLPVRNHVFIFLCVVSSFPVKLEFWNRGYLQIK